MVERFELLAYRSQNTVTCRKAFRERPAVGIVAVLLDVTSDNARKKHADAKRTPWRNAINIASFFTTMLI